MEKIKFIGVLLVCFLAMTVLWACGQDDSTDGLAKPNRPATGDEPHDTDGDLDPSEECDFAAWDAACEIGCPYGYATDQNGCRLCECAEVAAPILPENCELLTCPARCEDYLLDGNFCMTCECG